MSAGAAIWKHLISRTDTSAREQTRPAVVLNSVSEPAFSLMHQIFLSGAQRRKSILFVATDRENAASHICEQIAMALARVTEEKVAIVQSDMPLEPLRKKPAMSASEPAWHGAAPVAERVRKVSADVLRNYGAKGRNCEELSNLFEYLLLPAAVTDSAFPVFCNLCDAAVLLITANATRRQAALQAKEELLRHGVNLLGVVLDQRQMPIPESIYRRL